MPLDPLTLAVRGTIQPAETPAVSDCDGLTGWTPVTGYDPNVIANLVTGWSLGGDQEQVGLLPRGDLPVLVQGEASAIGCGVQRAVFHEPSIPRSPDLRQAGTGTRGAGSGVTGLTGVAGASRGCRRTGLVIGMISISRLFGPMSPMTPMLVACERPVKRCETKPIDSGHWEGRVHIAPERLSGAFLSVSRSKSCSETRQPSGR